MFDLAYVKRALRVLRYPRGRWKDGTYVEVRRQGLHWRLDPSKYIDRQILTASAFEPKTTELVRRTLKPGMHVLDVGANIGYFTVVMGNAVGPTGRIFAFEPTARYRSRLRWHVEANRMVDRVAAFGYGLSNESDTTTIEIQDSTATLINPTPDSTTGRETISLRRLDDVVEECGITKLDFVKVDIDGHESHFIEGAEETLVRFKPIIVIEFSHMHLEAAGGGVERLKAQIEALGYELHSEEKGRPFQSRVEFMMECGNYSHSANAWAYPVRKQTW